MGTPRPLANGISTDHPIPDLPFVDDSHIPTSAPRDIEAIGRGVGEGMWGRWDGKEDGEWQAFTTDPIRHDMAWCVRHHPEHGRSVLLYRDSDAAIVHMEWWEDRRLLSRSGGYWWNGTTWYRPAQVWDAASETYDRRQANAAVTVTAADLLDPSPDAADGRLVKVPNFDPDDPPTAQWPADLALWAQRRDQREEETTPLSACVVKVSAPELAGDQLVGIPEMAKIAGIAASTLRAYISRGEGDVPEPQATLHGRSAWAQPVAEDWAEARSRSSDSVTAAVTEDEEYSLPVGASEVRERFTRRFFSLLWERPERRKRWALRHRTETAVGQVADELGTTVATGVGGIIPMYDLAMTIRHAILDEFATGRDLHRDTGHGDEDPIFFGIVPGVAKMLDWLVRHHPDAAKHAIADVIGEAERRWGISREVSGYSLRSALHMVGKLESAALNEYLDRVLPPSGTH